MRTLHDRMQADIHIRRYSPCTEKEYLRCCFNFTKHFMRSPVEMGEEEVRAFLVHLVEVAKVSASVQKKGVEKSLLSAIVFCPADLQGPFFAILSCVSQSKD